jgi:hypothetical protein
MITVLVSIVSVNGIGIPRLVPALSAFTLLHPEHNALRNQQVIGIAVFRYSVWVVEDSPLLLVCTLRE